MMLLRQLSHARETQPQGTPTMALWWYKGGFHAGKGSIIGAGVRNVTIPPVIDSFCACPPITYHSVFMSISDPYSPPLCCRFSFMDSLNFFGSNLGLWQGLGLFQILESTVGKLLERQFWRKISSFFMLK